MEPSSFPIPLARAALTVMPARALAQVVAIVQRKMESRHPKLFANLARLAPATVHLNPTDVPHAFGLRLGADSTPFYVLSDPQEQAQASISGSLESLITMLEGRVDGDTLFFARDIQVTGDTEIIVGLRNTMDREEINLLDEIVALCGPFAKPARAALTLADHLARGVRAHIDRVHAEMHKTKDQADPHGTVS